MIVEGCSQSPVIELGAQRAGVANYTYGESWAIDETPEVCWRVIRGLPR